MKKITTLAGLVLILATGLHLTGRASERAIEGWEIAGREAAAGFEFSVYIEAEERPGAPAFRIETALDATPAEAAVTLMSHMVATGESTTSGETRKLLERSEREALVHTYVDLPFLFSDRELAIRIRHTDDGRTGIHRIDWVDENEVLPPVRDKRVLRLSTKGYWEFRPVGAEETEATYVTRAEVGGSLPSAMSRRLMRSQAIDAVARLHRLLRERSETHVAAPPPGEIEVR